MLSRGSFITVSSIKLESQQQIQLSLAEKSIVASLFSRTALGITACISLALHGINHLTISVCTLERAEYLVAPESKNL